MWSTHLYDCAKLKLNFQNSQLTRHRRRRCYRFLPRCRLDRDIAVTVVQCLAHTANHTDTSLSGMPDWHFRSQKHQKLAAWRSCWLRKKSGRMPTKVGTILAACGICWLRTNIFRMPTDVGIILATCKILACILAF